MKVCDLSLILNKTAIVVLALFTMLPLAITATAAPNDFNQCLQHFANSKPPVIQRQQNMKPRALCFESFAVLHSGKSRTPIYVAERLSRAIIEKDIERADRFYEEARLPRAERATLDDYKDSGFDRGHMAPAADMGTDKAMAQSFSLANIVPQAPINNRKAWAKIEKDTRKYVMRAVGDVYVITGPVYEANAATIGNNKVWVPQHLFKLIYDPSGHRAWVHWLDNKDEARVGKPISYQELVQRTGVDFLPGYALH
jgi:endonuclease G